MKNTLGIVRNKTHLLIKYKDDQKEQLNRFKKQNRNDLHVPSLRYLQQHEEANSLLLERRNGSGESTASNFSIELQAQQKGLASGWNTQYENTIDRIRQVQDSIRELHLLGTKRLKLQFGDASGLERQIYENNQKATQNLMECEQNIEYIAKYESDKESESEYKIRINIQRALAGQIQELTNQLRNQQKRMVTLIKQIHKDEGGDFLKLSQEKQQEMKVADNDLTQAEEQLYDDISQERDHEINKLVTMINDLAEVFKSLNQLVLDQGTILDRIDYNIDCTLHNVKQANVQLKKAEEYQNSPLAKRCIIILVMLIAICSVLLTIKYSS